MAIIFDDSMPYNPEEWGLGPPPPRGVGGALKDYAIEIANAVLGGGAAISSFAAPGSEFAQLLEDTVQELAAKQSLETQQAKQELSEGIEAGGLEALETVGRYALTSPGLAVSQAIGSFAIPFGAIRAAGVGARALGAGREAVRAGRAAGPLRAIDERALAAPAVRPYEMAAGVVSGAALAGGDAAGNAYEMTYQGLIAQDVPEEEARATATQAAREASIVPAAIGGAAGVFGAEALLFGRGATAGTRIVKTPGGQMTISTGGTSILRTAGSEALQEAVEEGATAGSANIAAGQYVEGIDPMRGVVGSAALGGLLGGITGGGVAALTGQPLLARRQSGSMLKGSNDELDGIGSPSAQAISEAINTGGGFKTSASSLLGEFNTVTAQQEATREAEINAALQAAPPPSPAQQAPQPTPSPQQASQITAQQQQATTQAYGITPVAQAPIPTWEVAGQPLYGQPTVQRFVNDLAQLNAAKSPDRVALESAVARSGLIKLGKPDAKSLVNTTNKFLEKYQLGQVQTIDEAAVIINDQIRHLGQDGKGVTDKNVDALARLYDALTGQEAPSYTQIAEGVRDEQATTGLGAVPEQAGTDRDIVGGGRPDDRQLQSLVTGSVPEGPPSIQDVTAGVGGARGGPAVAPAGRISGDGGALAGQAQVQGEISGQAPTPTTQAAPAEGQAVQAQPVPSAQPVGVAPSPLTQEQIAAGRQAWEDMDVSGVAYDSLTENDRADWDQAVAEGRATGEMQEQLANEYQIAQEEAFAQQVLGRVMNRVIKSPNKARYFATFLAAGANQNDILAKAEAAAEKNPDGTLTDKAKKYIADLRQNLSALRGAPNQQLADEYGVALDTLKEWNQELRTFLTDKAKQLQNALKVVAVEMRIGGTDVQAMLEGIAARAQQAQTDLVTTIQPDNVVLDERDLTGWTARGEEGTGITAMDRTAASVQEVFNASETINARFIRLQEQLVEAENEGNQELVDQINTELERLTEEGLKQAKKQAAKRPTKEKKDAVQKREAKKVPVGERARGRQEVGKRDTEGQKAAREGKAEEKVLTTAETAEAAWNELRSSMPANIQEAIPTWNNLTEAQQKRVIGVGAELNMRNVEQIIGEGGFAVQRVNFRALTGEPGVESAMRVFRGLEIDRIVDMVDEYQVLPENSTSDGQYDVVNGKTILKFKLSVLGEGTRYTAHVVRHEFGHVVDEAASGGIYSSQPQMALVVKDGKVTPVGVVAKEVFGLYKSDNLWNEFMSYPFERKEYDAQRMQAEMFAQLWSMYTDPNTRQEYMSKAPVASAYMNEVVKHVQKLTDEIRRKEEGAIESEAERLTLRIQGKRVPQGKGRPQQTTTGPFAVEAGRAPRAFMQGLSPEAINQRIEQFPQPVRNTMRATSTGLRGWWRKGLNYIAFTQAVINRAVEAGIPSAAKFGRLLQERGALASALEREVEGIADMYANVPDSERGIGDNSVNAYIFESTRQKKWGFQPDWTSTKVTIDPATEAAFNKLSPESQSFIKAIFKHGDDMLALKKATVLAYTNSEYDSLILDAANTGDTAEAARLRKQKVDELERFKGLFAIREGLPYAPIKRTGNYVVVAKSEQYREAEANNDLKTLKELQKDPDHYHVSFVNGEVEAQRLQAQLLDQGHFGNDPQSVDYFERENEAVRNQLYGGNNFLLSVTRLRSQIDAQGDSATDPSSLAAFNQMRKIVTDMYLESLAEASARKSEIRRRGVSGEVDMLNSFTLQGRADANFISAIRYGNEIQQAIADMRKEAKKPGNRNAKSELYNELMARYAKTLEFEPMAATQKLTRLTSIWFLATSPGYYLQNLTQPYMMSLPLMAARHDIGNASNELYKAYKDLKDLFKDFKVDQQFDFSKVPADVREAIEMLVIRSRIDIGLNTEMGQFTVEGQGFFTDRWNKIDKVLRLAVQKVEAVNRLSTAIAAYRLELQRPNSNKEKALEYADQILTDTHGDYTAWAAPRAFNTNIGKVALQFRKFQLIQLSLIAKLINESLTGKDRAVARKALAYTLGNTAIMTGVVGMPGFAAIAWALGALFGDEDEPFNLEQTLREYIGDGDLANMILRGAPTLGGVDLSGKIGMGNMLSVLPFTEIDKLDGQKTYEIIGTLLGGPAGGLASRAADGVAYIANGDYWKGLEMMTPKGMGDLMRAIRVSGEGVTNRRGDVLLGSDDLGELDTFWRAIGLAPIKQTVRSAKQAAKFELEQRFSDRTSRIKNDYVKAYKAKDTAKMAEARRAWAELQEARQRNGYKIQPLSNLIKAPFEQAKRERMTIGGIQYDTSSREYVRRLTQ